MKRVISIAAALILLGAAPARAALTIGQLTPNGAGAQNCGPTSGGFLQSTVTSDRPYAVPANGLRITSWSTAALATSGQQIALTVYRPLGGTTYQAVTHDGPHPLTASAVNTFSVNIPVRPGDVLGLNPGGTNFPTACGFQVAGETGELTSFPSAPPTDGNSLAFNANPGNRLNVTAKVDVSNAFSIDAVRRNKHKGTAAVTVSAVGPGRLVVAGKRFEDHEATLGNAAETLTLTAAPAGKLKRSLEKRGKARGVVSVSFTPDGGDTNVQSQSVKFIKKR